jgi:hypothetical protein
MGTASFGGSSPYMEQARRAHKAFEATTQLTRSLPSWTRTEMPAAESKEGVVYLGLEAGSVELDSMTLDIPLLVQQQLIPLAHHMSLQR